MRQIIVASHGNLAKGVEETLQLFTSNVQGISYISAYTTDNTTLSAQLDDIVAKIDQDGAIFFTDIKGGSVNLQIMQRVAELDNVYVIAGFNLPMVMEAVISKEPLSKAFAEHVVEKGREAVELVTLPQSGSEEDKDFFE